ncbi:amidase [Klebsiella michiganensis]|uniref:amidase n=1 Tax=Klebsiella michiganensis TaxID=1134687 RepID=UPI0025966262|nr:amidase [Klebsiella michiganensis]MDM4126554.1 amidase [Klebsiella michiganensis]MDM4163371.1 amidase [Klebsiella michiganensis]HCE9036908.1 amidase [Klebsiella michiganensis]HCE9049081.1 amidase [Klebsiella michiganensis]HDX9145890.1 amidase [Klebsiella michiganensis]
MKKILDTSPFNTIAATRRLLEARKISPSELLSHFLSRIEQRDGEVKAWRYLDKEGARQRALELDRQMGAIACKPALFGIPYGAKDIFHTRGLPTEGGSRVLEGYISSENASVIDKLDSMGALLLGKLTTTEFANLGTPPLTGNAWNPEHTPGGSSSGSAAAVGTRMALMALGTQTAGSLSRPAAFNGVTALKATYGRISKAGVIPASWSLDHVGAFTHTVEDAVLVFNALSGPDHRDDTTQSLAYTSLKLREKHDYIVGIVDHPYYASVDAEIGAACLRAMDDLAGRGVKLKRITLPDCFDEACRAHHTVMQAECAAYHHETFLQNPTLFGAYLQEFLQQGLTISAQEYLHAQQVRLRFRQMLTALFDEVDILMTPATPTLAPRGLAETGSPAYNMPFTNAGVPTLTLPVGISSTGMPIGIQWVSRHGNEQALVDLGIFYQQITDWHACLPPLCQG